ncbi:MAG: N-acyl-D-amino-acid deacylase family protein [Spirochaetota bacterium]
MATRLLIQNGTVYDGTGAQPSASDILIENGKIAAIAPRGTIKAANAKRIDAKGMWVTPGFLDTHTHYDAELALSPGLTESVRHGVTSVVVGSCSVSFVASSPEDCADMFTRVEAVPREVVLPLLKKIKKWDSPLGYRKWIDKHPIGPNVASFMGHSDLRARAMGLHRSVTGERPTPAEQKQMETLLAEALDAGFLGMSCMTNPWDRLDGEREWSASLPSYYARRAEKKPLLELLRRRHRIHQSAPNLITRVNVLGMALASGGIVREPLRTTVITMMDLKADPYVLQLAQLVSWLANKVFRGNYRWQSPPVPFDLYYDGWDSVLFEEFFAGQKIRDAAKDLEKRHALLEDKSFRHRFKKDMLRKLAPKVWHRDLSDTTILSCPDKSLIGKSFADVAAARGQDVIDTFLDLLLTYDRGIRWHTCLANHRPEKVAEIMKNPATLMSFADSGAHLRNMAFYNFPLRMLKQVHDAELAGKPIMPVEKAVWRLTGELAGWFGLDAGVLKPGAQADVVVIDAKRLDNSLEKVKLMPWSKGFKFDRIVNEGAAARHVFIAGQAAIVNGKPAPALGKKRMGRFLESVF